MHAGGALFSNWGGLWRSTLFDAHVADDFAVGKGSTVGGEGCAEHSVATILSSWVAGLRLRGTAWFSLLQGVAVEEKKYNSGENSDIGTTQLPDSA